MGGATSTKRRTRPAPSSLDTLESTGSSEDAHRKPTRRCFSSSNHHHLLTAMSRAEQIRGKLFGKEKAPSDPKSNGGDASASRPAVDVPLTIHIPKPVPPSQPAPPPKLKDSKPDSSPRPEQARDPRSFRERLVERLSHEYHGAERYRLVQDDNKELHWKRWGPYVSDRQWVSLPPLYPSRPRYTPCRDRFTHAGLARVRLGTGM